MELELELELELEGKDERMGELCEKSSAWEHGRKTKEGRETDEAGEVDDSVGSEKEKERLEGEELEGKGVRIPKKIKTLHKVGKRNRVIIQGKLS